MVVVRSTAYPSNPKTVVAQLIAKLITGGGRRVVVEDSDWRTMLAFESFREKHGAAATFAPWQTQTRPLTSLDSLRAILDLDRLTRASSSAGPRTQGSTSQVLGRRIFAWHPHRV